MAHFLIFDLPILSTLAACALAIVKGDSPERQAAIVMLVAWVCESLLIWQKMSYVVMTNALFAVDVVVLVMLVALTYASRRGWLVLMTSLQALQITAHVARDLGLRIDNDAYYNAIAASGYAQIVSLVIGTIVAWREREALLSFGLIDQDGNVVSRARPISPSVFSTPKIATKDPNRGPWF